MKKQDIQMRNMPPEIWPSALRLVALAVAVALADLATKYMAVMHLAGTPLRLTSFFSLSVGFNAGISFGLFPAQSYWGWALIVSATSLVAASVSYAAFVSAQPAERVGYTAIAGGAIGNIVDRLSDGHVTDFLDLHWAGWHWPAFNLADTAITVGVALLLTAMWFETAAAKRTRSS